jgi:hypothetical protein
VIDQKIGSGTKVTILEIVEKGDWVKIETAEGDVGYVKVAAVREI